MSGNIILWCLPQKKTIKTWLFFYLVLNMFFSLLQPWFWEKSWLFCAERTRKTHFREVSQWCEVAKWTVRTRKCLRWETRRTLFWMTRSSDRTVLSLWLKLIRMWESGQLLPEWAVATEASLSITAAWIAASPNPHSLMKTLLGYF